MEMVTIRPQLWRLVASFVYHFAWWGCWLMMPLAYSDTQTHIGLWLGLVVATDGLLAGYLGVWRKAVAVQVSDDGLRLMRGDRVIRSLPANEFQFDTYKTTLRRIVTVRYLFYHDRVTARQRSQRLYSLRQADFEELAHQTIRLNSQETIARQVASTHRALDLPQVYQLQRPLAIAAYLRITWLASAGLLALVGAVGAGIGLSIYRYDFGKPWHWGSAVISLITLILSVLVIWLAIDLLIRAWRRFQMMKQLMPESITLSKAGVSYGDQFHPIEQIVTLWMTSPYGGSFLLSLWIYLLDGNQQRIIQVPAGSRQLSGIYSDYVTCYRDLPAYLATMKPRLARLEDDA